MPKPFAVVNPKSANGSTGREWDRIHARLRQGLGELDFAFTTRMGDAIGITRRALQKGHDLIVSVGGDGNNNEVVNGFFDGDRPVNDGAALGFICRGTGGDLRKTLGVPKELDAACDRLVRGARKRIDLGRFSFVGPNNEPAMRHFVNITSFGLGGEADERVNRTTKVFGGFVSFLWGALVSMAFYKNKLVRLKVDDQDLGEMRILNVAVANGRFFGGGMMVAPQADPCDGLFDVIIMGDLNRLEVVTQMSRIYKGTHLSHPKVRMLRGRVVEARTEETVLLDVDGEQPGRLPARIEILPSALTVIV